VFNFAAATVQSPRRNCSIGFQGDPVRYPCHAMLNIGDEVIWDGAELKGAMCADSMPQIVNAIVTLQATGPRFTSPGFYNLFWYSVNSDFDKGKAKYDGNGFTPINREYEEPPHHVRDLLPPGGFTWPPSKERVVAKDVCVMCADPRTAAVFKLEAFDLATAGYHLPYTRFS
jgi:uncharacterized repeat protein (TIGR04076 family)